MKAILKKVIQGFGLEPRTFTEKIDTFSIRWALGQQNLSNLVKELERVVPDITDQYSRKRERSEHWKLKVRGLHAFQCCLMLSTLDSCPGKDLTVVDIGDSAGTHMLYLKELGKKRFNINTISVNLDPRAVEKIRALGLEAKLCRAEELDLGESQVDLFMSFEMVEHLHNPAIFFRRLAKKSRGDKMVITVPYLKHSRVGLYQIRKPAYAPYFAEDEHIFELSPQDWTLLLCHAGWRVAHSAIYYQYPRRIPMLSPLLAAFWRRTDFEGFWGAILEKDTGLSDLYQDWED